MKPAQVNTTNEYGIPVDVADNITLAVLQDHYNYLTQELKLYKETGSYMHPADVKNSQENLIPALKTLVQYFGGKI